MYRWVEHTAEVELSIDAATEQEVLEGAMAALAELLGFAGIGGSEQRSLKARAADRPALLAAWLEELVYLAESEGFVATSVDRIIFSDDEVQAMLSGAVADPPPLVKAVTYHRLTFERGGSGYVATVVLDV